MSETILSLICSAIENEKAAYEYIEMYSKTLETQSLKKLLVSITDQEREHENQLTELLEKNIVQEAFADKIVNTIHINSFNKIVGLKRNLSPTQVLQLLMKYYEYTETVYKQLSNAALDSEIRLIFLKLSEGELKLKQWVHDRYDLESLSG